MAPLREDQRDAGRAAGPPGSGRGRWRTVAFVLITMWLCVAIAVVFFQGLGDARRSGAAEEVAAQYQQYLRGGWFPLEIDAVTSATHQQSWLGQNYSKGSVSTIVPARGWRMLRLRLAPVDCSNNQPLSVAVREGSTTVATFSPSARWRWYAIRLTGANRVVTLHYSCVAVQQTPGLGLRGARHLAIALSGVSG